MILDETWREDDLLPEDGATVACPYCGALVELSLDTGGGPVQVYVEDCDTCCRPMQLTVRWDDEGAAEVDAVPENS